MNQIDMIKNYLLKQGVSADTLDQYDTHYTLVEDVPKLLQESTVSVAAENRILGFEYDSEDYNLDGEY
jgi:hypothetical protein